MLAASAALPASVTTAPMKVAGASGCQCSVVDRSSDAVASRLNPQASSEGMALPGWRQGCPWARVQSACMCDSFESVVLHSRHPPVPKAVPPVLPAAVRKASSRQARPAADVWLSVFTRARTTTGVLWRDTAFSRVIPRKAGSSSNSRSWGRRRKGLRQRVLWRIAADSRRRLWLQL